MQGFHPQIARKHLADGGPVGFIGRVKQLAGMDEAYNARVKAYKEGKAAAPAPAPAAPAPAPAAPAPAPAVTDYTGMSAAQRREKAAGLADGGLVRGPGTGTSDDIPADLPVGSYIMPADSTNAIGADALGSMGGVNRKGFKPDRAQKVKAQISNGEYNLPPEQVHAIGVEALDKMKGATHTPVAQQEDPDRVYLVNGGPTTYEELRRQNELYQPNPTGQAVPPIATSNSLESRVAQIPTGGQTAPAAPVAAPPAPSRPFTNPFPNTTAVARGASEDVSAAWNAGNPAQAAGAALRGAITTPITAVGESAYNVVAPWGRGIASFARGLTGAQEEAPTQAPSVATPTAPRPAGAAPTAAAPVSAPMSVKSSMPSSDIVPAAQTPTPGQPGAVEVMPGVFRNGNSYGGSAAATAPTGNTGQPNAQNDLAASNLAARGFNPAAAQSAMAPQVGGVPAPIAPIARSSANDWALRKEIDNARTAASSITNTRRWGGRNPSNADALELEALLRADTAARGAQPGLDQESMRQTGALQREGIQQQGNLTREQIQQGGANARAAAGFNVDRARLAIDGSRAASENAQRGVATAGAQQLQDLRNVIADPNATAAQRQQATLALQALQRQPAPPANRYTVVPGGQEWDPAAGAMRNVRATVLDNQTGQFVPQQQAQATQAAPAKGQVMVDANGNRARWDGSKYVPL